MRLSRIIEWKLLQKTDYKTCFSFLLNEIDLSFPSLIQNDKNVRLRHASHTDKTQEKKTTNINAKKERVEKDTFSIN